MLKAIKSRGSSNKKSINNGLKMTVNAPANDYLHLMVRRYRLLEIKA